MGRYTIGGYDLISSTPDARFGRATYVRSDVANASAVSLFHFCDIIQVGGFRVANVYKHPSQHWDQGVLPALVHPVAYVGDFNSHHPEWSYSEPDEDGEALVEWASSSDLTLIHDAKQSGTFYSARWQKDYSPDLCWVTSIGDYPQPISQTVLGDFARFIVHADNSRKKDATSMAPGKSHRHSETWQGLKFCGQLSPNILAIHVFQDTRKLDPLPNQPSLGENNHR